MSVASRATPALTAHQMAVVIKARVDRFSDKRLHDGDDVWEARETEYRRGVAETANALVVVLKAQLPEFDVAKFAAECGLFVSDGRDTYSDCFPGELTWEAPRG